MWMSESRAKRCGSVETSSARSQDGERRAAVAAREPLRKLRRETGFNVIGISLWAFQIANRKLQIINSLSPSFKRYSDFRQQFKGVVVIELLEAIIGQSQATDLRLFIRRKIRIEDGRGADVSGFPELAMDPKAAGKEIEAALVVADLIGAEKDAVLVGNEELSGLLAAGGDFPGHPAGCATIEI